MPTRRSLPNPRYITDPIHGTIAVTSPEVDILQTRAFQRLHRIKHLGLAHLVFPGSQFSRFAHGLGACHVMGRLLSAIRKDGNVKLSEKQVQYYRLAALLHDVGHYPFSHAVEHAVDDYYKSALLVSGNVKKIATGPYSPAYNHVMLGKELLLNDVELSEAIKRHGFDPDQIASIFRREGRKKFANLISSDLDADRIDFLLRSAHYSGLPYGSVDIDYLMGQIRVDTKGQVCLDERALKTADHFLLCRYFDYQQVVYHKTVVAFEQLLGRLVRCSLDAGILDCSSRSMDRQIRRREWHDFDDDYLLSRIRKLEKEGNTTAKTLATGLLERRPPKEMYDRTVIAGNDAADAYKQITKRIEEKLKSWADTFGIRREYWFTWKKDVTLASMGSLVEVSAIADPSPESQDRLEQLIRIQPRGSSTSVPITEMPASMMHVLGDKVIYMTRVYVLLPPDREGEKEKIRKAICKDLET